MDRDVATQLHAAAGHAQCSGRDGSRGRVDRGGHRSAASRRIRTSARHGSLRPRPLLRLAGEADRARALLEAAIAELPAGPIRSDALLELADDVSSDPGGGGLELGLVDQAIVEAGGDKRRRAAALIYRAMLERARYSLDAALAIAREALELAEQIDDPSRARRGPHADGRPGDPARTSVATRSPAFSAPSSSTLMTAFDVEFSAPDDARRRPDPGR